MTRQHAPATERNREPILEVLCECCLEWHRLEVASGTGEHAVFCPRLKPRKWLPSDPNQARVTLPHGVNTPFDNLYPPLDLDVRAPIWPVETDTLPDWLNCADFNTSQLVIVNINMIHISPWLAGLMAGAGRLSQPAVFSICMVHLNKAQSTPRQVI